jgi:hypothetical protein
MTFPQHLRLNLAAILLLAMPIYLQGFAPATVRMVHRTPTVNMPISSFDRRITLNSSAASSMEIPPTAGSQGSLNKVQATVVKFLMVAYIASMCVALPAYV